MKILVTGGAGFIGSHLVDALIAKEHDVTVIDNLSTGTKENIHPKAHFHHADIRDEGVQKIIAAERPEAIFHLAAQIDVGASMKDPITDAQINIVGSLNVLEGARKAGVKRFIFSSTGGAIYGEADQLPTPETYTEQPLSHYGIGKLAVEKYLILYNRYYHLNFISLRYANVYGPRQNSKGEAGVVAIFSDKILRNEPFTINGEGTHTRDYVYVDDVVRANLLSLESDTVGFYNIATGVETDVNAISQLIQQAAGVNVLAENGPERTGDVLRSCLDSTRFQQEFSWRPEVNLEEGIKRTVEWFKKI